MNNSLQQSLASYASDATACIGRTDFATLGRIAEILLAKKASGNTVFLIGNGGSAATASHVTNDLVKGCAVNNKPGFRAMCLSDSSTLVTCLANDFSYADIYAFLLRTHARPGDVVIAFSGSGNSPNILRALETARELGLTRIGFGGRDGGKMKALCDPFLLAPTNSMELLEDLHLFYFHNLACAMRAELEKI